MSKKIAAKYFCFLSSICKFVGNSVNYITIQSTILNLKYLFCKRALGLFILFVIPLASLFAQSYDFNGFTALRCAGDIPLDFRQLTIEKYKIQKAGIDKRQARWSRKAHNQFILESNFFLNEVLLSGYVLFNDPVTNYINKVADKLLENETALRQKLRFYALKSPGVNAFATDQGIIFVNIGLIAQLENEAQLAFVLAHEITHYVKKHTLSLYLESEKMKENQGRYARYSYDDKIFTHHHRSREMENEADDYGMELYEKTNYSIQAVKGIFDVLLYSELPFDEIPFSPGFLETPYFKINPDHLLKKLNPITAAEDYDDTDASHPNIKRRREKINSIINKMDNSGKQNYLISEAEFKEVRTLSRFECLNQYLIDRDYANAFYNTFLLKKEFPENAFLDGIFAASLYGLAKYHNMGKISEVMSHHSKIEGQKQQVHYLFRAMKPAELSVLAIYHCFKTHLKYPSNNYISSITYDLYYDLKHIHKLELSEFRKALPEAQAKDTTARDAESKYERIRLAKQLTKKDDKIYDAFIDLFSNPEFEYFFIGSEKETEISKLRKIEFDEETPAEREARQKEERRIKRSGYALNLNKIVVVDPVYYIVDQSRKNKVRFIDSEEAMQTYKERISKNARRLNLKTEIVDTRNLGVENVDNFNNFTRLNEWIMERGNHGENIVIQYTSSNVEELTQHFNSEVFVWTGAYSMKEKSNINAGAICLTIINPLLLPCLIYEIAQPRYKTSFYFLVVNIKTGEPLMVAANVLDMNDTGDVSNSYIYNVLYQIKNRRKHAETRK